MKKWNFISFARKKKKEKQINFISFAFFDEFCDFSAKFWWILSEKKKKKKKMSEFHGNVQKMTECIDILRKMPETFGKC